MNYILQQAVERASASYPSLKNKRVFPHIFRHSCALHLLQSGVDIAVIALWLRSESIQTTHGYIEADLAIKERALQKLAPARYNIVYWIALGAIYRGWARAFSVTQPKVFVDRGRNRVFRANGSMLGMPFYLALKAEALHLANRTW